jgi:two-component system chemotaxis response regulator CheB
MACAVVVIGGSAGALAPLREIVGGLPSTLPATVLVVIHTSPDAPGEMATILARRAALPVTFAADGDRVQPQRVLIAPADHHLLLVDGRVTVTRGPRENGFRPAVDPLFRTAARWYGDRVIGIVLSGSLDDGTGGLKCVKDAGGIAIVQRPEEASSGGMPASAIRNVAVDHVVGTDAIAALVTRLVEAIAAREESKESPMTIKQRHEIDPAVAGTRALEDGSLPGPPSVFTCPECGGSLWEVTNGNFARFACHVGHSYSPEALESGMADVLESALWTALRALEENAAFYRRMHDRTVDRGLAEIATSYAVKAQESSERADVIRKVLTRDVAPVTQPAPASPSRD